VVGKKRGPRSVLKAWEKKELSVSAGTPQAEDFDEIRRRNTEEAASLR